MSSNGERGKSQREREVIEQQKRLAERIGKHQINKAHSKHRPSATIKAGGLTFKAADLSKRPSTANVPKKEGTSGKLPAIQRKPALKRPSRPSLKRPSSVATVLAAARAKAVSRNDGRVSHSTKHNNEPNPQLDSSSSEKVESKTDYPIDSQKLKRKVKLDKSLKSSHLASLVVNVAKEEASTSSSSISTASFALNTVPDDFWKNLREWDFAMDLGRQQKQQELPKDRGTTSVKKAIPDTFISARHYVATWAPLCLAETRAQLVSEVLTEFGQKPRRNAFTLVDVETTWKSPRRERAVHTELMDLDSCRVRLNAKQRGGDNQQFYANDVCCLIPVQHKDIVERLLRGGQTHDMFDSLKKCCMIGHTEVQRREINGLILKVSKRKWAQIGCSEMFLLRIGGNITALREFTALCKVETIPLKKYLLGNHLEKAKEPLTRANQVAKEKEALLRKMGGVQALGKGFTVYAEQKFNQSQLMAISASAEGYGDGGITLIKGPPGTGKTTTLVAVLNSLHIRQYNKYYEEVRRIAAMQSGNRQVALGIARKAKPRLLVCAPSNAAVDNIILKIMEDGFVDGSGQRYNPSMIRVGVGSSTAVRDVTLETKVDQILSENLDLGQLESSIAAFRMELQRISADIVKCRKRVHAIANASSWPLSKDWEIRVDEDSFEETGRVYFVNHKDHTTTYECPPPPEPGETHFAARSMPEYRAFMARIVKLVETYFAVKSNLERSIIVKGSSENGADHFAVRQSLESHVLNSVHMVMTTLGTAGNRVLEAADKFEVVVVDEAAQSVEPATLSALQLGSRHCVLVGDPQQLPATIFNVSGRHTKYDRSLFQRLEEAGQQVFMLNQQYRMHPQISHFPRRIFYDNMLCDGPNVVEKNYGQPLLGLIRSGVPSFQPFTVLDLDSREQRGGTSLSNSTEAHLAVHLYSSLKVVTHGLSTQSRVAIITPYSQQARLLRRCFSDLLGSNFMRFVEINTVDAFQGREAKIVIFSAVRAAGSHGIGFLSDVRRMNVALTRAKYFLFVIARCESIVVNPYWKDLVQHARETNAVVRVPILRHPGKSSERPLFGNLSEWKPEQATLGGHPPSDPRKRKRT